MSKSPSTPPFETWSIVKTACSRHCTNPPPSSGGTSTRRSDHRGNESSSSSSTMTMTIAKAMTKAATETRRNETRMTKGLRISSPLSKSVRVRPTRSSRGTRTWGTVLAVEAERANRWVSERTTRRRPRRRRRPRPSPWRSTRFDQSRTVASDGSGESKSGGDREEGVTL